MGQLHLPGSARARSLTMRACLSSKRDVMAVLNCCTLVSLRVCSSRWG
jgi:hypothetical protein